MAETDIQQPGWNKMNYMPVLVREVDLSGGYKAWLVIDSLASGAALGGIRLGEEVCLQEVEELAAEMTLKFSFLNHFAGGAKAGIRAPSNLARDNRQKLFQCFGEEIADLLKNRSYFPGTDIGTYPDDIDSLFLGANIMTGDTADKSDLDSGYFTAISVFAALCSVASELGISLHGASIGIQGLGKVGLNLFQIAHQHGMKVVAISTIKGTLYSEDGLNFGKIMALVVQHGDSFVSHYQGGTLVPVDMFFHQKMDFMCPCAGRYSVHRGNALAINARAIIPASNVVARPQIMDELNASGTIFLPGFVCNSGGVLCYLLEDYGFFKDEIEVLIDRGIQQKVHGLLKMARTHEVSPSTMAYQVARRNQRRFEVETVSRNRGKLQFAYTRLKMSGLQELYRTALWSLVKGGTLRLNTPRGIIAQSVLFGRLFTVKL